MRFLAAIAPLAVASCAVAPAPAPTAAAAAGAGTVLAVRPIAPAVAAGADGGAWRAALLDQASDSGGGASPAGAPLAEFIVREDDGATLSIVQPVGAQPESAGLHAGDRVVMTHPAGLAGRPTLARLL
jgi:hypothetical protein